MRTNLVCATALLLLFSTACGGGSSSDMTSADGSTPSPGFNLDFGASFTGLPDTYAGASSQAGPWVDCAIGTTNALRNSAGTVTGASITLEGDSDAIGGLSTDTALLIADSVVNGLSPDVLPFSATFSGLVNGAYDVYYYFWFRTSGLIANGVEFRARRYGHVLPRLFGELPDFAPRG